MPAVNGMVQLDTNFLVQAQVAGSVEEARYQQLVRAGEVISISAVAWGEYLCGPVTADEVAAARYLVGDIQPLVFADAELEARLFNSTGRRSRSFAGCMIAAIAIQSAATLATSNTADFLPFVPHGLVLA